MDFTGLEAFNNGKGAVSTDRNYVVDGQPGVFAGGDVIRPHLLTTAIGHGSIAADGINSFLHGKDLEKRPKIDAHQFDLMRKMAEKGLEPKQTDEPMRGTCNSNVAVHNFDNRSDRYIIPHDKLFLGHFSFTPRNVRNVITLDKETALGNFQDRLGVLSEKEAVAEAKRCMSCGMCFECDNCVVYCPQTAVFARQEDRGYLGSLCGQPTTTTVSAATSVPMFAQPGTFKWVWVSDETARIPAALHELFGGLGRRSEHAKTGHRPGRRVRAGSPVDAQKSHALAQASA